MHVLYPPGAAVGWGVVEWREEGSSAVRAGEAAIASKESGREGAGVESGSAVAGGVGEVEVTAFVSFAVFVWKGVSERVRERYCLGEFGRGVVDLVDSSDLDKGSEDSDWDYEMR